MMNSKLVIVLGMHRSGTSALSSYLHFKGINFGENLLPANEYNPRGFYEHKDLVELNERLLNHLGYEWFSVNAIPENDLDIARLASFYQEAIRLTTRLLSNGGSVGIKDPRLCRLLPFWNEVFDAVGIKPIYLLTVRSPIDVAKSLQRRNGFSLEKGIELWLRYNFDVLDDVSLLGDCEVVDFDELLEDYAGVDAYLTRFFDREGVSLGGQGDVSKGLFPELRHNAHAKISELPVVNRLFIFAGVLHHKLKIYAGKSSLNKAMLEIKRDVSDFEDIEVVLETLGRWDGFRTVRACMKHASGLEIQRDQLVIEQEKLQTLVIEQNAKIEKLLQERIKELEEENSRLNLALEQQAGLVVQLDDVQREYAHYQESIRRSVSWRLTAPVRSIKDVFNATHSRVSPVYQMSRRLGVGRSIRYATRILKEEGIAGFRQRLRQVQAVQPDQINYEKWVQQFDTLDESSRKAFVAAAERIRQPLISVVMPVYNPPLDLLREALDSVRQQLYSNWELCIADDLSDNEELRELIVAYAKEDDRIRYIFRQENGHISKATNSALELVTGEFVALMDHDDLLPEHALFWVAHAINEYPEAKMFYSDEDKIDVSGNRHDPYFKCDWNPDLFYSHNMFSHLGVYRADLLREIEGFRVGLEGSQDYDLALRCIEKIDASQIIHIPRVLYHWRVVEGSTALDASEKPYAMIAGERAINEHLERQGIKASCKLLDWGYRVKYQLSHEPLVSIIIPTRDHVDDLRACLNSIYGKTAYNNYEVIIVDNGSVDPATLQYLEELRVQKQVTIIRDDSEFNYSYLNNLGVDAAKGEIISLMNNDIVADAPEWMTEMVSHAMRPEVGAVGCRLVYPDNTLQHAGIILGLGGLAAYSHRCIPRSSPGYFGRAMLIQSMSAVTAACLFVRKSAYLEVGGLDEKNLAVAYNDVDFCLRLKEAGYRNIFTPYAELIHHESKSRGPEDTREKQERAQCEFDYMRARWGSVLDNDPAYNPNLTLDREDFSIAERPRVGHVI
jgi:GT2 family glycosyltransferase